MSKLDKFCCPLDQLALVRSDRSLVCANGHAYDIAKSGYVNLLPVQKKHSKDPGDSKEMVAARKAFLNQDFYFPIIERIVSSMPNALNNLATLSILDAGCGEGYYLRKMHDVLSSKQQIEAIGLDISKWAITEASKQHKTIDWVVGSNANIPVSDDTFDCLMCAFGFPVFLEFTRTLKTDGWLLLVESGANHLVELRNILYPELKPYKQTYLEGIDGFILRSEVQHSFSFSLNDSEQIAWLLAMTPHIHKASYDGRQAALALKQIDLTADITLRWYQKQGKNHVD